MRCWKLCSPRTISYMSRRSHHCRIFLFLFFFRNWWAMNFCKYLHIVLLYYWVGDVLPHWTVWILNASKNGISVDIKCYQLLVYCVHVLLGRKLLSVVNTLFHWEELFFFPLRRYVRCIFSFRKAKRKEGIQTDHISTPWLLKHCALYLQDSS